MVRWQALVLAFAALAASASAGHAEGAPWAAGVTEEQKANAKVLLDAGNALLLDKNYLEALQRYTAAITVWDHPAIHFNRVRCLIQLGRNLEAFESLERALQYGAAPLEETVYSEAIAYQKLLGSQVGRIAVSCTQADVKLTLDGKPLASCPTQVTRRVLAGPHQIVGTKQGLLPRTVELVVIGAEDHELAIKLDPLAKGARIVHRWPTYLPWTVFGGGLALAGAGALFVYLGNEQMKLFDANVLDRCTGNCQPGELDDVMYLKRGAEVRSGIGVSLLVTGGASVVTGAVLIYLNRGRTVYPESLPAVTPIPGGAAMTWAGSF
jgi:tetratricopeptide (TPR) repeat protein